MRNVVLFALFGGTALAGFCLLRRRAGSKFGASFATDWKLTRKKELITDRGTIPLKKIGKGTFSTVYVTPENRVIAIVPEDVYDKQITESAHQELPANPRIPAIKRIGHLTNGDRVFEMPRYTTPLRPAALKPEDRKAWTTIKTCLAKPTQARWNEAHNVTVEQLECMQNAKLEPSVYDALEALHTHSTNYSSDFRMEISPRNAAVDAHGNLVLLDVFFDSAELVKRRAAKTPQRRVGW